MVSYLSMRRGGRKSRAGVSGGEEMGVSFAEKRGLMGASGKGQGQKPLATTQLTHEGPEGLNLEVSCHSNRFFTRKWDLITRENAIRRCD